MRVLAVFAGSFSAAVFGANYLLPAALWLPLGLGLAGGCALWCVVGVRRGGRLRLGAALVMAGAGLGLVWSAGYDRVFLEPARALDGTTVRLTATAVQWPEPSRYDGVSVEVWAQVPEGPPVRALLYLDEQGETLRPGDRLETVARCHLADRSTGGEETDYYLSRGVFLWCTGYGLLTVDGAEEPPLWALPACLARALRESIGALFPARETGLIQAVVLGERDGLEESYSTALQRVGLSHTVAVSGMHLGFLAGLLGTLLGKHSRRSALVIFPTVVCFAMMTGCTPSVVRAAVMILLLQLAPLLGREQDGPTSLSFALMLLLLHNPFAAAHVGLQLSFAAVAGIQLTGERVRGRLTELFRLRYSRKARLPARLKNWALGFAVSVLSVTLSAMLFTVPLTALHFGSVSLAAPLANLLGILAVEVCFCGGLAAGVLGCLIPCLGVAASWLTLPAVQYLEWMVPLLSRIPTAAVSMNAPCYRAWVVFCCMLGLLTVCMPGRKRLALPLAAVAMTWAAAGAVHTCHYQSGSMTLTALDVGQGQSVLLSMGGRLILVDCGGDGARDAGDVAADWIQGLGRNTLDLLVVTHYHSDHVNGLPALLERVETELLAMPGGGEEDPARLELETLAREQGIRLLTVERDTTVYMGEEAGVELFAPLDAQEENERGLTVLAWAGEYAALLTGDLSGESEQRLLAHEQLPEVEVLLAGHHGAADSTTQALLETVRPEIAVVSCGLGNVYGHPDQGTLERLDRMGTEIYRTDLQGTVTVTMR